MSSGEFAVNMEAESPKKMSPLAAVKNVPGDIALPSLDSPQKSTSSRGSGPKPPRSSKNSSRSRSRKHSSSGRHRSSSKGSSGSSSKVQECVCGRGIVCFGMSQAFRMLGDPRCHHVELPRYRKNAPAFKYVFRNNLRQAYLRELVRQNPDNEKLKAELEDPETSVPKKRKFVALHHFHPRVVRAFYENPLTSAKKHKVPISITEHELGQLGMECYEDDKILSISGFPTGGYYFTPNYPHEKAHEDLKSLIQAVRNARNRDTKKKSEKKQDAGPKDVGPKVPADIEISTPKSEKDDSQEAKPAPSFESEKEESIEKEEVDRDQASTLKESHRRPESDSMSGLLGDDADDFEKIWDNSYSREIESSLVPETVIEEEEFEAKEEVEIDEKPEVKASESTLPVRDSLSSRRSVDRPWATPKYRRDRARPPSVVTGAAAYIDPTNTGELNDKLASKSEVEDDGEDIARIAADMTIVDVQQNPLVSPLTPASPVRNKSEPKFEWSVSPNRASYSPKSPKRWSMGDDEVSLDSADSDLQNFIKLDHAFPGGDPTIRIQVHNDLIAWESKRRSDLAQQLEYNEERWKTARDILTDGVGEAKYAERLILGTSKASRLFADSLNAVYDDKLLDDKGNAVRNSFVRNRLAKQRKAVEYSIGEDSKEGSGLGSVLLDSIVSAQKEIANAFVKNSEHIEQEILPEMMEFKALIDADSTRILSIGDAVLSELKQSEVEVKNIWDVFDAMITGDLMEYTVHGSSHGGSSHGGSYHGGSYHGGSYHGGSYHGGSMHSTSMTGGSGSIHGFLTLRDDNEGPIVSSASAPLVKSSFQQLGRVEDGWLIEMYYKSAVSYQRSVFAAADMELRNLFQEISSLEEIRFRKLHQIMLAFAPRQRRLFNQLPEHLKNVLENMVGLRIDEESLQKVLDESVKDRSRDRLKGSTAHKSSIMNRSRINTPVNNAENEIEDMENTFGSPFASPQILLSKIVELKATGLKSLVNTAWKPSLAVVTSEGNLLVFETTGNANTPPEAFKSLYPQMNFDDQNTWVTGRKAGIAKSLTPIVSLRLLKSNVVVSPMRKSQLEITEETRNAAKGSRFMSAMRQTKSKLSGTQQTKCTLRLPSPTDASDWARLLERTQKVLASKAKTRTSSGRSF